MMLESMGFIVDTAAYLTSDCGIASLEEIAYLDGDGDVEITIKDVTSPGGTVNVGAGTSSVRAHKIGSLY
jgi:hypothetical protein